jgi:dihydrofolate reductase
MPIRFTTTMSIDGYTAGPNQSLEHPLGEGGEDLHGWAVTTRSFRAAHGMEGGEVGLDDDRVAWWSANVGATIMGRNMFGPVRGPWGDEDWQGWWGDDPPFHTPVFVLTHHAREPLEMEGGTTFHFVTEGIEAALERALDAAAGRDVMIGGGARAARRPGRLRMRRARQLASGRALSLRQAGVRRKPHPRHASCAGGRAATRPPASGLRRSP